QYLSNYATLQLLDRLSRVPGVAGARPFGGRGFNMRGWVDPGRAASVDLTVDGGVAAIRAQNMQGAGGAIGPAPVNRGGTAFQLGIQTHGRLQSVDEFRDVIVKTDATGRATHLGDLARVELGAEDYSLNAYLSGKSTVGIGISQLPGSNALTTAEAV